MSASCWMPSLTQTGTGSQGLSERNGVASLRIRFRPDFCWCVVCAPMQTIARRSKLVGAKAEGSIMATKPIPEGYHSVTPYLIVKGAAEAIDFVRRNRYRYGAS
jgi:hypothetical protein